jgi:PD-(D/E)XK nuclease superfamily
MTTFEGYTRVTDVLEPFSGLQNVPAHILNKAAVRGTYVHDRIDAIVNGMGFRGPLAPEWEGYVTSFLKWNSDPTGFHKPLRFFCDELKITGECDAIYGESVLIDFKTSAQESKSWKLQTSAYAYLARKAGYAVNMTWVIHLNKDGDLPNVYKYEEDFETFLACLKAYRYFNN